jgi:hypothetical protein
MTNILSRLQAAWRAFKGVDAALRIQTVKLGPNDAVLVHTDRMISIDQANRIKSAINNWLQGGALPIEVLDSGMALTIVNRKHMGHQSLVEGGYQPRPYPNPRPAAPRRHP